MFVTIIITVDVCLFCFAIFGKASAAQCLRWWDRGDAPVVTVFLSGNRTLGGWSSIAGDIIALPVVRGRVPSGTPAPGSHLCVACLRLFGCLWLSTSRMEDFLPMLRRRQIQGFILGGGLLCQASVRPSHSLGNADQVQFWKAFPHSASAPGSMLISRSFLQAENRGEPLQPCHGWAPS